MTESSKSPFENRQKRRWTALGATIVVAVIGLALAPGLARREPTSLPKPQTYDARLEREAKGLEPKGDRAQIESAEAVTPLDLTTSLEAHSFDCMVMPNDVIEIGSAITGLIEELPVESIPEPPLDQARDAEVSIVDPLIDGPSGTFGARLLLPNPDRDLPAGLRCQVRFFDDS